MKVLVSFCKDRELLIAYVYVLNASCLNKQFSPLTKTL